MFAPAPGGFGDPSAGLGGPGFAAPGGFAGDGGLAAGGYGAPDGGFALGGYATPPPGCGAGPPAAGAPGSPGSLQLAPQELEYYQQLFGFADPDGRGVLEGLACANFLYGSGLPQDVLHRIWDISDRHKQGFLNAEGFFVALRLVAHAQAGRPPDPQLVPVEPPALPDFPNLQRRRAPSEVSPPPGSGSPSVCGGAGGSEISELQPVIAGEEQVRRAATAAARLASRSASPRAFTRERWTPSRRERRKYASLFKRTDSDGDGFVQGGEAQVLLERSRLSREQLMVAWEHADRDRDGRLDFREFVCLVHLVTCILRGAPLPGPAEELPYELTSALVSLEPLEVLAAEREASRSRSASPLASRSGRHDSPEFPPRSPRERGRSVGWTGFGQETESGAPARSLFDEGAAAAPPGFPAPEPEPDAGSKGAFGFEAQNDAFTSEAFGAFDAPPEDSSKGKKSKDKDKRKGRRSRSPEEGSPPSGAEAGFGVDVAGAGAFPDVGGGAWDPFTTTEPSPAGVGEFGGRQDFGGGGAGSGLSAAETRRQLDAAASQFEAVSSADQQVSRQLRKEVDELSGELRHVQDTHAQLERQVQAELEECQRLDAERRRLEGQVQQARSHFMALQEDRRSASLESLSLRRDRGHFVEETAFLRRMAADEEGTLEVLRTANQFLERSQRELEAQAEALDLERRDTLRLAGREKELVQQSERQNAELRNRLERLRRERATALVERQEASMREERIRDMQSHGAQPRTTPDGRPLEPPAPSASGRHTWATAAAAAPASKLGSAASAGPVGFATAPPRVAALSREGV